MNDKDRDHVLRLIDMREKRLREELKIEQSERDYQRMKKANDWMLRGAFGFIVFGVLLLWVLNLTQ